MNAYKKMLNAFGAADYDTLVSTARTAALKLRESCTALPCKWEELAGYVMLSGVGADGKVSATEKKFIKDVLDPEDVEALIAAYRPELAAYVDRMADNNGAAVKGAILTLIAATAAVDHNISAGENELLRKILR